MGTEIVAYNEFRDQLSQMKQNNTGLVFNYEDPAGNREARSHVYKLRQTKAAVDKVRKKIKEESLEVGRKIDAEAKEIIGEIEGMIDTHMKPLEAIEEREQQRVQKIRDRIESIRNAPFQRNGTGGMLASPELKGLLEAVRTTVIDESFAEFQFEAQQVWDASVTSLEASYAAAVKNEAELAELARLRVEADERSRKDRDEQVRRDTEEKSRKEADARVEAERKASANREVNLRLEAERAQREKQDANERADKAAQTERERIERKQAEEAKAEREATEKREADKKHRAKINSAAVEALVAGGMKIDHAKQAITLIAKGSVPNVSVSY